MKSIKKAAALKYNKHEDTAPVVVAKGQGQVAQKIIALAQAHNLPLYEDKNLMQVLEALDLNTEIPQELYQAVAEILVFVYRLNQKYEKT